MLSNEVFAVHIKLWSKKKNIVYATWLFFKNLIKKLLTLQLANSLILQAPKQIS